MSASGNPARRPAWRLWLGCGLVLGLVLAAVLRGEARARLNPDERAVAGRWYGYRHDDAAEYAWLSDYRTDRSCRIQFRNFYEGDASDVSEEFGRWHCAGGRRVCETWHPGGEVTRWDQLVGLMTGFEWREQSSFHEEYELVLVRPQECVYLQVGENITYRAVRVPDDFVLPAEPLQPEEALAWHAAKRAGPPRDAK